MAINLSTLLTPIKYGTSFGSQQSSMLAAQDAGFGMSTADVASAMGQAGPVMSVFGAVNSAIGSYYQAKSAEYQLQSQASTLAFQADMAKLNQRRAEFQAYTIMEAGARQIGAQTMKAGQVKGAATASMAARGVQLGVGSAAEVIATTDLMKEIDTLTLNTNRVRASEEAKMQGVNYGNQAAMLGVSSRNAMASADSISPFGSAMTSLMGSASSLSSSWYQNRKLQGIADALGVKG